MLQLTIKIVNYYKIGKILFDTHSVLVRVEEEYENKLAKARAKQPKAEW